MDKKIRIYCPKCQSYKDIKSEIFGQGIDCYVLSCDHKVERSLAKKEE